MNFKLKIIAATFFVVLSSFVSLHKYYVSVTDIEYTNESKAIQITSRLFIDDFEKVLKERYDETIKIDSEYADLYIGKYYSKKLQVSINNEVQEFVFLGKEFEGDMIHCYFEIENIEQFKLIEISNKLLFDSFENQQNITHLKVNETKKSFLLIKDNDTGLLKL